MADFITFSVVGSPVGQGSKTPGMRKNGSLYVREAVKAVKPYRDLVKAAALEARPIGHKPMTNVIAHVWAYYRRPPSHYFTGENSHVVKPTAPKYPIVKPDLDKVARLIFDASKDARLIKDDSHIIEMHFTKRYADLLEPVGLNITLEAQE